MERKAHDVPPHTGGKDREIEQRAHAIVGAHHHFHGRAAHFAFECREGVLIVRGSVSTFYLKQVLQRVLKDVDGIRTIDNQVTVISVERGD